MNERGGTNLLFVAGIGLVILGAAIYGLFVLLGIGFAVGEASQETGTPVYLILLVPGIVVLGLLLLFIKVVADRLASKEDDHYSKTVEK
ncbi:MULTISPECIES: hypothetical protein [Henriciella]|jgi:hypothetical protein|uniref:DUF3955 domain-containing protein n=1 Tax=Henriciella pelagia TaxID=1977912 RepID=A0ABQ1J3C9_9PROT|nr:hypothetical protein [Henriciella pelagia]GGB57653.1 hypothetical protein GCM10011503_02550 [Henriciella pelagia]